jgi:hypothetical protein
MADLNDLVNACNDITPFIKDIFAALKEKKDIDTSAGTKAINNLKKLVNEAQQSTQMTKDQCATALSSAYSAITEIMIQAATSKNSISISNANILTQQQTAIQQSLGLLAMKDTFGNIPTLLANNEIDKIKIMLDSADNAIKDKMAAAKALKITVDVVIAVGKIVVAVASFI